MKHIALIDQSLLDALAILSPKSSKTTLRSWIKEGRVSIDEQPAKLPNQVVLKDQTVTVDARKKTLDAGIVILYEDEDLVVIDKPSGLLSVAANFEKKETAHGILKAYYRTRKIYVVHRLDQDTSGVMLFAFSEQAYERLKKMFEAHTLERCYTAIVEGRMAVSSGTWQSYLYEDENYVMHSSYNPEDGQEAITHFKIIDHSKYYSWLNLKLETGRKNQIRVHCQDTGHPVVGDKKYGAHTNPVKRLCLHAHLLALKHPLSSKMLRFESPIPQEFYRLIRPSS